MTQEEIKQFKRFIKEKGVYKAFMDNYDEVERKLSLHNKTINNFLNTVRFTRVFIEAFGWLSSKEGGDFWSEIDVDWCYYIKNL